MKPKVCILAAGIGSRLGERTRFFNNEILIIGNKAAISHNIDAFDDDLEYVIALGYQADIVRQYIELAHPDKNITFIETDKYSGPGAGAGYALLQCQEELQCPFYFICCDSLISGWHLCLQDTHDIDWVVTDYVCDDDKGKYCTVKIEDRYVVDFFDKSNEGTNDVFTGIAFIKNYKIFFTELNKSRTETTEIRDTPALFSLNPYVFSRKWWDIGTEQGLEQTKKEFEGFDNLDKIDEEIYHVDDYIIKYFYNANIIKDRLLRINHLNGTTPKIMKSSKNFYKYKYIDGQDLFSRKTTPKEMRNVLDLAQKKLWSHKKEVNNLQEKLFKDTCKKFYYDKTIMRVKKFQERWNMDGDPDLDHLFKKINWDYLSDGIPTRFHGDFNFSNIIATTNNEFKFIDWRQNFGDSVEYGDLYYDLSKMYHSFLFPHPSIKMGKFYIKLEDYKTFIEIPYHIEKSKDTFEKWVTEHDYDLYKIKLLTAIVLLNMSPLHESPIDEYLYVYAKNYLDEVLHER